LGAVATVTWGSFAWALGKACSPPKVGVGATCAVVAISLLWMPLLWLGMPMMALISWLRLFVLFGLSGYVIKQNS
jgi:hypothetical protein